MGLYYYYYYYYYTIGHCWVWDLIYESFDIMGVEDCPEFESGPHYGVHSRWRYGLMYSVDVIRRDDDGVVVEREVFGARMVFTVATALRPCQKRNREKAFKYTGREKAYDKYPPSEGWELDLSTEKVSINDLPDTVLR